MAEKHHLWRRVIKNLNIYKLQIFERDDSVGVTRTITSTRRTFERARDYIQGNIGTGQVNSPRIDPDVGERLDFGLVTKADAASLCTINLEGTTVISFVFLTRIQLNLVKGRTEVFSGLGSACLRHTWSFLGRLFWDSYRFCCISYPSRWCTAYAHNF